MSNFFKKLFENDDKISIEKIILSLFGIVIIRTFFENFSSADPSGYFFSWKDAYLQFPIYYASIFLSFGLLLYFLTKKSLNQILNFEIKIFLFALLPPIIDLLVTKGKGSAILYIVTEPQKLPIAFFELLNPITSSGITFGVHVAAYLILIFLSIFIYRATRNILRAFLGIFIGYAIFFFYAITPSIIVAPHFLQNSPVSVSEAYRSIFEQSWTMMTQTSLGDKIFTYQNIGTSASLNEPVTQLFFLYLTFQVGLFFIIFKPNLFASVKRNLCPERIVYWFIIAAIGIAINQKIFNDIIFLNSINIISLLVFFTLIILNIWFAVCVNDQEDIAIDKISNPTRPLAAETISLSEWKAIQTILALLVFLGILTMNRSVMFLFLLAQMLYYIYSARPLRLKSNFIFSSIIIGLASIAIAMAGFFLVSPDQHFDAFPINAILIIGISYALLSNLKDIKDFEGDRHENIKTMPVVFGLERAKHIIAFLCALVIITVPVVLKIHSILFLSICVSLFLFYLFTKKEYQEKYIFLVFFLYIAVLFFVTL